jgi:hypothetical protein
VTWRLDDLATTSRVDDSNILLFALQAALALAASLG